MEENNSVNLNRSFINAVVRRGRAKYDFPFGRYIALNQFFSELSRIQEALIDNGTVKLSTGKELDFSEGPSISDMLVLNVHMDQLEAVKQSISGLSDLGLNFEKKVWTSLQS
jgi:hypothetical protein